MVIPEATGQLVYEIPIIGTPTSPDVLTPGDGLYYVDATTGDLVDLRHAAAAALALAAGAAPGEGRAQRLGARPRLGYVGDPCRATDLLGHQLTAMGTRTAARASYSSTRRRPL